MGLFSRNKSDKKELFPWIQLHEINQIEELKVRSSSRAQLIFKHSTRCGISRIVLNRFENQFRNNNHIDFYYLDLLNNRELSNQIANDFKVIHESPQVLVVKNKTCLQSVSHYKISELELNY